MTNEDILEAFVKSDYENWTDTLVQYRKGHTDLCLNHSSLIGMLQEARQQGAAEQRVNFRKVESVFWEAWSCVPFKIDRDRLGKMFNEAIANAESKLTEGNIRTQGETKSDEQIQSDFRKARREAFERYDETQGEEGAKG